MALIPVFIFRDDNARWTILPADVFRKNESGQDWEGRISIFEKLRAQAKRSKFQTPSSKTDLRAVCPGACFWVLGLEIWHCSGA
jgi:hypothetical protein